VIRRELAVGKFSGSNAHESAQIRRGCLKSRNKIGNGLKRPVSDFLFGCQPLELTADGRSSRIRDFLDNPHAAAKWPEFSLTFAFMGRIVRVAP